jgi:hypothetical protein
MRAGAVKAYVEFVRYAERLHETLASTETAHAR